VESNWVHSGTAATNRPIVPAPGDYDNGEIGGMIGRGLAKSRCKAKEVLSGGFWNGHSHWDKDKINVNFNTEWVRRLVPGVQEETESPAAVYWVWEYEGEEHVPRWEDVTRFGFVNAVTGTKA
jgi:hypothetical protein